MAIAFTDWAVALWRDEKNESKDDANDASKNKNVYSSRWSHVHQSHAVRDHAQVDSLELPGVNKWLYIAMSFFLVC